MTDALLEAEGFLEQLPEAVNQRKLGQRLTEAVNALRNVDHQVGRIRALVELTALLGYGATKDQRDMVSEMTETAKEVGEMLADADTEQTLRAAVHDYADILPKAIAALERAIRERWLTVVGERFTPLIEIGKLLGAMNVSDNLGRRLSECGIKAQSSTNVGTVTGLLPQVRALQTDYEALQAERAREIGDDEVGEFVNALAERKATLDLVTDKVRDWLEAHKALDRFAITPRPTGTG